MEEDPNQRRQRRIAGRQEQIIDAAARLFAEKGYHGATTKEIAQAANVAEGTIYNYFAGKEDLLMGIMARLAKAEQYDQAQAQSLSEDPRSYFRAMLQYRRAFINQNNLMLQALLSEILVNPLLRERYYREIVQPNLAALQAHLDERSRLGQVKLLDTSAVARLVGGLLFGLYLFEVLGDPLLEDWDRLVEVMVALFFDGLAPRSGGEDLTAGGEP